MVNSQNINDERITIYQHWEGDRLDGFVKAVLKECSCSMMLITG